jgi:hypothetical protein
MRHVLWLTILSGCAFEVNGVNGANDVTPGVDLGAAVAPDLAQAQSPDLLGVIAVPPLSPPDPQNDDTQDMGPVEQMSRIGDPCDPSKNPCSKGQTCETKVVIQGDVPGGYCSQDCKNTPCPAGSQCSTQWTNHICIETCPAAGCRQGYVCCTNGWMAPGVCLTPNLCSNGS